MSISGRYKGSQPLVGDLDLPGDHWCAFPHEGLPCGPELGEGQDETGQSWGGKTNERRLRLELMGLPFYQLCF